MRLRPFDCRSADGCFLITVESVSSTARPKPICQLRATAEASLVGTLHAVTAVIPARGRIPRREYVQKTMAVMLICPKCRADTELRGTMDAYYLTWCPDCERLWRLEVWTLVNAYDQQRKMPWLTSS